MKINTVTIGRGCVNGFVTAVSHKLKRLQQTNQAQFWILLKYILEKYFRSFKQSHSKAVAREAVAKGASL
jgi:hypothetical protein